ncbi:hypothetical protein E3N88_01581 [Mikania micrantha]|uniref:Uncharacterized protein n=1 Tax=Mikania micrantha TaxID=192012 RepID=A0A5N6Q1C7_9ASTR|nr:hypothetical protein E3N88_01581 [Mikania micrantha]
MATIRRTIFSALSNSPTQARNNTNYKWISTTIHLNQSWMNKIKGAFTGKKTDSSTNEEVLSKSFTLLSKYRHLSAPICPNLEKIDDFNIQPSQKQEAAKMCKCTIADVENTLARFTWAKEAQKKIEKLKEEGKPMPKSLAEVQKLMGSTPMDIANSSMAKSGQISRNALCPCGSKKRYKREHNQEETAYLIVYWYVLDP